MADNLYLAYGLGDRIRSVREFGPASTSSLVTLATGTGTDPFVFTPYNAPALPTLPAGAGPVLPGALKRTFKLVQVMKGLPPYTEDMGLDMGIVGSEAPPPRPTVSVISGATNEYVRVKFFKDGHEYVVIECRRGGGDFEQAGMSNKSPFIDSRPLLVPGQAEVREYRMRFFDNGSPSSGWTDISVVTVGP